MIRIAVLSQNLQISSCNMLILCRFEDNKLIKKKLAIIRLYFKKSDP